MPIDLGLGFIWCGAVYPTCPQCDGRKYIKWGFYGPIELCPVCKGKGCVTPKKKEEE